MSRWRIDWSNPLTRGLVFAWNAADGRHAAHPSGRYADTRYSALPLNSVDQGDVTLYRGQQSIRWAADASLLQQVAPGTGDFTVAVCSSPLQGQTDVRVEFDYWIAAGAAQWRLQPNYNGSSISANAYSFLTYTPGLGFANAGANSLIDGTRTVWVGRRKSTDHRLFKNGISVAQTTATARNLVSGLTPRLSIGYWGGSSGTAFGGQSAAAYWGRGLSDAEIAEFSENPWQLFAPDLARSYFFGTAAGGPTTYPWTATGGATLSGAATLAKVKNFVGTGSMSLDGSASLAKWKNFVGTGGATLTGTATTSGPSNAYGYLYFMSRPRASGVRPV